MRNSVRAVNGPANAMRKGRWIDALVADTAMPGYWTHGIVVVLAMAAVVAARMHEFIPFAGVVKPVFTVTIVGTILLVSRSTPSVRRKLTDHPVSRLVLAYFACAVISIPLAMWKGGAINYVQFMLPGILAYAAFTYVPPTRIVLNRLTLGYVVLILMFAAYLQMRSVGSGRLRSASGTWDSNDVAVILSMALPLAIGFLTRSAGYRERIAAIMAVVALVLGVVATGSRGGTLAMLTAALVFVTGLKGERRMLVLGAMVVGGMIVWTTAPRFFRDRIRSMTNLEKDYNFTAYGGRKEVWRRARQIIKDNPLGVGAGNFAIADGGVVQSEGMTGKWSNTHNAYLQATAELGLHGGSVFILMLLTAGIVSLRLWKHPPRTRAPPRIEPLHRPEYLAALCAFAVGGYFLSHAYFQPLFVTLGLVTLADRVRRQEKLAPPQATTRDLHPAPQPTFAMGERGGLAWGAPAAMRRSRGLLP